LIRSWLLPFGESAEPLGAERANGSGAHASTLSSASRAPTSCRGIQRALTFLGNLPAKMFIPALYLGEFNKLRGLKISIHK